MNKVAQVSPIGAKVADANRIDPLEWDRGSILPPPTGWSTCSA